MSARRCSMTLGLRRMAVVAYFGAVLVAGPPAAAQSYGRWWWDGNLGYFSQEHETEFESAHSGLTRSELKVTLGLNGYIVDPNLGQFRIQLGTTLSDFANGSAAGTDSLTYSGSLRLFPRGSYVVDLWASRQRFDYQELADTAHRPRTLPDSSTLWGAKLRIRRGFLRGTRLGIERTKVDFVEAGSGHEGHEREFVEWTRSTGKFGHRAFLEHASRTFSRLGYSTDDVRADVREGWTGDQWRWRLHLNALSRDLVITGGARVGINVVSLENDLTRISANDNQLNLSYRYGLVANGVDRTSHIVLGRYTMQQWENWELTPSVSVALLQFPDQMVTAPQVGISASWNRTLGRFNLSFSQGVSYLSQQVSKDLGPDDRASTFGFSSGFSVAHGEETKLLKEINVSLSRNRLRDERSRPLPSCPTWGSASTIASARTGRRSAWLSSAAGSN